jgi:hypothetical protein
MGLIRKLFGAAGISNPPEKPIYVDMRSETERQIELRAKSPLGEVDERTAERLLALTYLQNTLRYGTPEWKRNREELRAIGTALFEQGGNDRMTLLAYRAACLGVRPCDLLWAWDGIGRWRQRGA